MNDSFMFNRFELSSLSDGKFQMDKEVDSVGCFALLSTEDEISIEKQENLLNIKIPDMFGELRFSNETDFNYDNLINTNYEVTLTETLTENNQNEIKEPTKVSKEKLRIDVINKKAKTHVFHFILEKLNSCLKLQSRAVVYKLSQKFLKDPKISTNKNIIYMKIKEIIELSAGLTKNNVESLNNLKVLKEEPFRNQEFAKLIDKPFIQWYKEYLKSDQLIKDIDKIANKENNNQTYKLILKEKFENYLDYYKEATAYKTTV